MFIVKIAIGFLVVVIFPYFFYSVGRIADKLTPNDDDIKSPHYIEEYAPMDYICYGLFTTFTLSIIGFLLFIVGNIIWCAIF